MSARSKFFIPPADRRLGDRYELLECLGDGSHGWVWRAQRLSDHQIVAVKIPKAQGDKNEELAEGQKLVGAPPHRNVVAIHWMGRVPPQREWYAIEMEYFPSQTLAQLLEKPDSGYVTTFSRVLDLYEQVLRGLAHLHNLGISHGDIKPQNILVSNDEAKITDFGSSLQPEEMYVRTRANGGTILYSAPEIVGNELTVRGSGAFIRADVYSLGVLLYHILTGRTPHDTSSQVIRYAPFPRPREISRGISPAIEDFTMRCLACEPLERWSSVSEMLEHFPRVRQQQLDYHPERLVGTFPTTQDWSTDAMREFESGNFAAAGEIARSRFESDREPHAFLLMLAAAREDGRFAECLRLIAAHPEFANHQEVRRTALDSFLHTRQIEKAAQVLDACLVDTPEHPELLLKKASILGLEAHYLEARDVLMDLNRRAPNQPRILRRLALVHEQLRDSGKAVVFLKLLCKVTPDDSWAREKLAAYQIPI
ncbi:serine/threonine protein kinase [Chthoniobacter flavus Ellin428]|uniref:Serine/threonine protein kinase n=1 Tax=Chthoniobacter flavus Ellin428 TaxID=497964 RepID=B4CXI3_9BACT|nr:serine/threonine-protein kinase [Chthoniobacter flavus]EDY20981.1 serine/threonine protein kinase [Chthoniobacter flavus Ellin428]TCO88709.1 serine/threonine-protein kinase [Chthoniobacter flavus]